MWQASAEKGLGSFVLSPGEDVVRSGKCREFVVLQLDLCWLVSGIRGRLQVLNPISRFPKVCLPLRETECQFP